MGLITKFIYKRAMRKASKTNINFPKELFDQIDTDKEVRDNCAASLLEIIKPLIQIALIEFKEKTCNKAEIKIHQDYKCSVSNNGRGIEENLLKNTPFSVAELMKSDDESFVNNIMKMVENQDDEEKANEIFEDSTIFGNIKKAIVSCGYFEIISNNNDKKFIKRYKYIYEPAKFKKCGKTIETGLIIIFTETINTLQKKSFGYDAISEFADSVAKENPGFMIVVNDERNNQQKQFKY